MNSEDENLRKVSEVSIFSEEEVLSRKATPAGGHVCGPQRPPQLGVKGSPLGIVEASNENLELRTSRMSFDTRFALKTLTGPPNDEVGVRGVRGYGGYEGDRYKDFEWLVRSGLRMSNFTSAEYTRLNTRIEQVIRHRENGQKI